MKSKKVPSDVIKATFHFLGSEERFPADIPKIHTVFFKISQKDEFRELFKNFIFDTSKAFPYSFTIRLALDRLQKSNLLSCINPSLDEFEVSKNLGSEESDSDIKKLFSDDEISLLQKVAEEFKKEISL